MSENWGPLPFWLKSLIGFFFVVMTYFAITLALDAEWVGAAISAVGVLTVAATFGPLSHLTGRLSSSQYQALAVAVLSGVWIVRFIANDSVSPRLSIVIAAAAGWLIKTIVSDGWTRSSLDDHRPESSTDRSRGNR